MTTRHDLVEPCNRSVASGAHVKLVQRMLGHASAAMTLNSLIEGSVKDHPK